MPESYAVIHHFRSGTDKGVMLEVACPCCFNMQRLRAPLNRDAAFYREPQRAECDPDLTFRVLWRDPTRAELIALARFTGSGPVPAQTRTRQDAALDHLAHLRAARH